MLSHIAAPMFYRCNYRTELLKFMIKRSLFLELGLLILKFEGVQIHFHGRQLSKLLLSPSEKGSIRKFALCFLLKRVLLYMERFSSLWSKFLPYNMSPFRRGMACSKIYETMAYSEHYCPFDITWKDVVCLAFYLK